jgi:hypothetical protein
MRFTYGREGSKAARRTTAGKSPATERQAGCSGTTRSADGWGRSRQRPAACARAAGGDGGFNDCWPSGFLGWSVEAVSRNNNQALFGIKGVALKWLLGLALQRCAPLTVECVGTVHGSMVLCNG